MLIGVCGGLCAGKTSVADYLVTHHDFVLLSLRRPIDSASTTARSASADQISPIKESQRLDLSTKTITFESAEDLLTYATTHWRDHFVTVSIWSQEILDVLSARPFFILISVDAPITLRWNRFCAQSTASGRDALDLESFVAKHDEHMYHQARGLAALPTQARIKLLNATTSLEKLWSSLDALHLTDESRIRPTWDQYFMTLANLAAKRSNCMRRQVGCVVIRDKRVISTGYNGTPRNVTNCNEGGCLRCNNSGGGGSALSTCRCVHAEENALLEAGRERIGGEATLYCTTCPCLTCSIKIVQVGIRHVVYSKSYYMDGEIAAIFAEAGVKLSQFSPPTEGLIALYDDPT